jgi:hypothetical protein
MVICSGFLHIDRQAMTSNIQANHQNMEPAATRSDRGNPAADPTPK